MQFHNFGSYSEGQEPDLRNHSHGLPSLDSSARYTAVRTELFDIINGQVEDGNLLISRVIQAPLEALPAIAEETFFAVQEISPSISELPSEASEALFVCARLIEQRGIPQAALLIDQALADQSRLLTTPSEKLRANYHMIQSLESNALPERAQSYVREINEIIGRELIYDFATLPILNALCCKALPEIAEKFFGSDNEDFIVAAANSIVATLENPLYQDSFHLHHDISLYTLGTAARVFQTLADLGYGTTQKAEKCFEQLEHRCLHAPPSSVSAEQLLQVGQHQFRLGKLDDAAFVVAEARRHANEEVHNDTDQLLSAINRLEAQLERGFE